MPTDPSIIDAASQAINNASNIFAQGNANRKTRKWNEKMYARQRADALSDWQMMNEYNHPSSQMARLREAGLNPNLVYGKGADVTAGDVRSSSPGSYRAQAAQTNFDARSALMTHYDIQTRQAQIDNLRTQNTVLDQEALLKRAQTLDVLQSGSRKQFDLELDKELRQVSADMRRETLNKLIADKTYTLDNNERQAIANDQSIQESAARIISMRYGNRLSSAQVREINARIKNHDLDGKLKQLDIDLKEKGVQPTDPLWSRVLARVIEEIFGGKLFKSVEQLKELNKQPLPGWWNK